VGGCEAATPVAVEPSLKYHPGLFGVLTSARDPGQGQCMVGSLTGAVSSQSVTEEHEGTLSAVGNRAFECKGIRVLNCETDKSSRYESRS
jgi:hypothetical protein